MGVIPSTKRVPAGRQKVRHGPRLSSRWDSKQGKYEPVTVVTGKSLPSLGD